MADQVTVQRPRPVEKPRPAAASQAPASEPAWLEAGLEISVRGPQGTWQTRTTGPFALVGAAAGCDLVLPQGAADEKAVYLHATRHGVFFVLLSSTEADAEVRRGWLDPTGLEFGDFHLTAKLMSAADQDATGRPDLLAPGTLQGDRPVIEISDGDRTARIQLSRHLAILGRSHPSTLRIKNRIVSALHAAVYAEQGRLWLVDLASSNGLRTGGSRVRVVALTPGDSISFGGPTLSLERFLPTPTPSETPPERPATSQFDETFPEPATLDPGSFSPRDTDPAPDEALPPQPQPAAAPTLDPQSSTLDPQSSPLDPRSSPLDPLIIDPSLGRLMQRETARQNRRRVVLISAAAVALVAIGSAGFWAYRQFVLPNPAVSIPDSELEPFSNGGNLAPDGDDLGTY
jgi:hypothetical protein